MPRLCHVLWRVIILTLRRISLVAKAAFGGIVLCALLATLGASPNLKTLYDQHRWFEPRDAIHGQSAPPLYQGAVAAAFNDTKSAEKFLNEAIRAEPASQNARDAHSILAKRDTITLPEISLRVGGFDAMLRPAQVYPKPVGDDFRHGLLGMDMLSQAREVRVDFTSMTIQLSR